MATMPQALLAALEEMTAGMDGARLERDAQTTA